MNILVFKGSWYSNEFLVLYGVCCMLAKWNLTYTRVDSLIGFRIHDKKLQSDPISQVFDETRQTFSMIYYFGSWTTLNLLEGAKEKRWPTENWVNKVAMVRQAYFNTTFKNTCKVFQLFISYLLSCTMLQDCAWLNISLNERNHKFYYCLPCICRPVSNHLSSDRYIVFRPYLYNDMGGFPFCKHKNTCKDHLHLHWYCYRHDLTGLYWV